MQGTEAVSALWGADCEGSRETSDRLRKAVPGKDMLEIHGRRRIGWRM